MIKYDVKSLIGGALLGLLGIACLVESFQYGIGPLSQMRAGNFPLMLSCLAIFISLLLMATALMGTGTWPEIAWRPLVAILAGIAAFAITIRPAGLFPAVVATVLICSLAGKEFRPLRSGLVSVLLAISAWLIFSYGLGMSLPFIRGII